MAKKRCQRCKAKIDEAMFLTHIGNCSGSGYTTGPFASNTPLDLDADYGTQEDVGGYLPDPPAQTAPYHWGPSSGQYMTAQGRRNPAPPARMNPFAPAPPSGGWTGSVQHEDQVVDNKYYYPAGGQAAPIPVHAPDSLARMEQDLATRLAALAAQKSAAACPSQQPAATGPSSQPAPKKRASKKSGDKTAKKPRKK